MATNTTNFGLKKPAYTDTADIADINGNMDKVDVSLNGLADAVAIVANNNTHAAITAGQYVYVHGHGSLAEGLYTAKSNIAANATLSTSNLQADGSGGLNALNSKITDITSGAVSGTGILYAKLGRIGFVKIGSGTYSGTTLGQLPSSMIPLNNYTPDFVDSYSNKRIQINSSGQVVCTETLNDAIIRGSVMYLLNN